MSNPGDTCAKMKSDWVDLALKDVSRSAPVLIAGPTASGKSALALAIACRDDRIIVNADALQVYARWRILTARPNLQDEAKADHRLYGHVGRDITYSVGDWLREVSEVLQTGKPVVIVGGTGLYFSALIEGLVDIPATPAEVRKIADFRRAKEGISGLLQELDVATSEKIDKANPARVQRAWEVLKSTGRGLSDWQSETGPALMPLRDADALVLRPDVDGLNSRIDQRFDAMLANGALAEVAAELPYWVPDKPSARAIGAAELIRHLRGDLSLDAAISAAKLASRQYAKRQRTWARSRMTGWNSIIPL